MLLAFGHVTCRFFFFNDTATTEIYTLSLHDALPISSYHTDAGHYAVTLQGLASAVTNGPLTALAGGRENTRLNSSHSQISYSVFCLKKNDVGVSQSAGGTPPPGADGEPCARGTERAG